MKNFGEEKILEILRRSDKALTYGEVLGECTNNDPYFASLATKLYFSKHASKLGLFFDDAYKEVESICSSYLTHILPRILNLERKGITQHARTNAKKGKRYETHINFVSDNEQKILKRLKSEMEKKRCIQPTLMSIAKDVVDKISEAYPISFKCAVLCGSGSDKNGRPFIYYGDVDEVMSVSDLDLAVYASDFMGLTKKLKSEFDEISRRRKIVLNPVAKTFRNSKEDRIMMETGILIQ